MPSRTFKVVIALALLAVSGVAVADVWKWVDAYGKTHFVDTDKTIYTWLDHNGKVHYADTPDHEDAVRVQLVWVSEQTLDEVVAKRSGSDDSSTGIAKDGGFAYPGESVEERAEREAAQAYYCKRAKQVRDSYSNAPDLYRTTESGERVILTEEETAAAIAESESRVKDLCQ